MSNQKEQLTLEIRRFYTKIFLQNQTLAPLRLEKNHSLRSANLGAVARWDKLLRLKY